MAIFVYSDNPTYVGELVGFAKTTGSEVVALSFLDKDAKDCGADKVIRIHSSSDCLEAYAQSIAALLVEQNAELFLVGATTRGRGFAAQVAGYLHCGMISDVSAIEYREGVVYTTRIVYGGMAQRNEQVEGRAVVTIPTGLFESVSGPSEVSEIELKADTRYKVAKESPIKTEGTDLESADIVISIGRGVSSLDDLALVNQLAEALGAQIGCTRPISEEKKWLPSSQYLGISGKTIKPKLLISIGVSGQVQHVFGVRDSRVIVAVDMNENAPIFKSADYGIVGDMSEVVPALIRVLEGAA